MAHLPPDSNLESLDSRYLLNHEGKPTDIDLTFHGRIPFGHEVLLHGGVPGVEYCWVLPENIDCMASLPPMDGHTWDQTHDFRWRINIVGGRGTVRGVTLLARGAPIVGASSQSGRRRWYCDNDIYIRTGIDNPLHQRKAGQVEAVATAEDAKPQTVKVGSRYVQAEAR